MKFYNLAYIFLLFSGFISNVAAAPLEAPTGLTQTLQSSSDFSGSSPRLTTYSWHPVTGAIKYCVTVQYVGDANWTPIIDALYINGKCTTGTSLTSEFIGAQRGRWSVIAYDNQNNPSPSSEWSEFVYSF